MVGDAAETVSASERALERGVFAQAIRPADRARRHLAAAAGRDGLAHAVGAARGRRRAGGGGPPVRSSARLASGARRARPRACSTRCATRPDAATRPCAGCSSPARTPASASRSGRVDLRCAGGERRAGGGLQAGGDGRSTSRRATGRRPRAAGRGGQRRAAPERGGPLPRSARRCRPTSPPSWPAMTIEPAVLLARARARRGRRRACSSARAWAGCSCRSPRAISCATSRVDLGLPVVVAARTGLGTINHTLLTVEAARAAGPPWRGVVMTPWPARAEPDRALERRDGRAARGRAGERPAAHHAGAPGRGGRRAAAGGLAATSQARLDGPRTEPAGRPTTGRARSKKLQERKVRHKERTSSTVPAWWCSAPCSSSPAS